MIMDQLVKYLDLVIVAGLILLAVGAVILVQMKLLPRQTLLFVGGAVLGIVGLTVANRWQKNRLLKDLEELNTRIKTRDQELERQRGQIKDQERVVAEVRGEYDRAKTAYARNILLLDAADEAERQRRAALSAPETFDEFEKAFGHPP
jgi:membrane protein implicated in regulation of membrane protease activity